ncbi:mycofactocin oligosaccharide methyltransferase MftM [Pseudonocardia thermophila]|uniref:mycofactocin oligosaccharide methyltransferase MftM n=1 Tax=Pseudonocardia thermophila TaxID=1848 RepID=UPI000937C3E0|nr:mycofactocin oligosaccharide methyltransferase MftM [Pseudonocardia thermophila]
MDERAVRRPSEGAGNRGNEPTRTGGGGLARPGGPIPLDRLDNDLAGWLERTLVRPGLLAPEAFERVFVALVESAAADPDAAWEAFYRNTLDRLAAGGGVPGGTIAEFAPVHDTAAALVRGRRVVELGSCFGFLSLRLARARHEVIAVDLVPGTAALLRRIATRLGLAVTAVAGDAVHPPLAASSADTVLAVHLLEHLPPEAGDRVIAQMQRIARRRAVVAVPFEDEPNPAWGHVRTFDLAALQELGARTGWPFRVFEHHGGWLVLDKP